MPCLSFTFRLQKHGTEDQTMQSQKRLAYLLQKHEYITEYIWCYIRKKPLRPRLVAPVKFLMLAHVYCSNLMSKRSLIRLIRFVSQFTSKLCNSFLFHLDLILYTCKILYRCDSIGILNFTTKQSFRECQSQLKGVVRNYHPAHTPSRSHP